MEWKVHDMVVLTPKNKGWISNDWRQFSCLELVLGGGDSTHNSYMVTSLLTLNHYLLEQLTPALRTLSELLSSSHSHAQAPIYHLRS